MKYTKYIIILIALGTVVASCSLDRSNPLDPEGNDITAPAKVTGLIIPEYSYQSVNMSWDAQENIPTYYVYRSPSYDGFYICVDTVYVAIDTVLTVVSAEDFDEELFSGIWYAYKVSAVTEEKLEGEPSNFVFTYFTDGDSKKNKR